MEWKLNRGCCLSSFVIALADYVAEEKASVFEEVLRPRFRTDATSKQKAIQVEIHVALSPKEIKASILLNKLRLIGIFDLIMELKSFVFDKIPESEGEDQSEYCSSLEVSGFQ